MSSMNDINLLAIGTDSEMFLKDKDSGKIISAEPYIRGSKHNPFFFDKNDKFFSTSLDNVMAEVTIPPAAPNEVQKFIDSLHKAMDYVRTCIPGNLEIYPVPSANLEEDQLMTEAAQLFG